ncbi:SurA N-terminal domain-containing protein [Shewanella sp. 10N.7]|uniref:SurA N-terminal domain-containing protein n=1 Tax=Shewanella sp. 10N.7 TaxID=2885093 RepID=UPI001E520BE8|nr:SurA N-terminal domain-containing protein [Shewanella sp. 10N.7]MCC4831563.1 SurA N-terminal domain-containing protein [Shewanella sp. 10N.7]
MLEKIREGSQGVIAKSILVLVILSFAFAGVSSYLGTSTDVAVAVVNGDDITANELEQAYQNERGRLEQQLGEMFDALSADDNYMNGIKQNVLDRLIADKLMSQAADDLGLRVSDDQIRQTIVNEPAFQTDGVFDNERYLAVLRQLGYQTASFRNMMRTDMTRRQLLTSLVGSEFVLDGEAKQLAEVQGQTRDIRYLVVDSAPYLASATVSDEAIKNYYDSNLMQFMDQEKVSLQYVELNVANIAEGVDASVEDARDFYEENKQQYQTPEKRLAAHILFASGDDSADEAKAEASLAKLNAGEDFADVAKTDSDDQFSAEQGGQLDWFEQGVMDPEFDTALFSLNQDEYSQVVKSEFGYHIVKLLDVQSGAAAPFEDVQDKIVADLKNKKAVDEFYSLQSILADTSYEVPDTLDETAQALNVEVQSTELFSRNNAPANLNKPDLIRAAFSDDVIGSGMNSEVIELEPNHVVVIRLLKHQDAGTLPLSEVKAGIEARLVQDQANLEASEKANELLAELKAGNEITEVTIATKAQLPRFSQDIDQAITTKAFQMPAPESGAVAFDTAALANGFAVIALDKVNAAEGIDSNVVDSIKQRLAPQYSEADYRSIIAALKAKAKIEYPVAE